jgi:hypothetical protein
MRHRIIKYRRTRVTHRELVVDLIFLAVAFLVSLAALFIFDVHWSLYPGETLFPPSKFVGISSSTYLAGSLIGTIVIFLLLKLFLIGVKEEIRK